jgi:hypothetical protein
MSFNSPPSSSISNLFGNWLKGVEKRINATLEFVCAFMSYTDCP